MTEPTTPQRQRVRVSRLAEYIGGTLHYVDGAPTVIESADDTPDKLHADRARLQAEVDDLRARLAAIGPAIIDVWDRFGPQLKQLADQVDDRPIPFTPVCAQLVPTTAPDLPYLCALDAGHHGDCSPNSEPTAPVAGDLREALELAAADVKAEEAGEAAGSLTVPNRSIRDAFNAGVDRMVDAADDLFGPEVERRVRAESRVVHEIREMLGMELADDEIVPALRAFHTLVVKERNLAEQQRDAFAAKANSLLDERQTAWADLRTRGELLRGMARKLTDQRRRTRDAMAVEADLWNQFVAAGVAHAHQFGPDGHCVAPACAASPSPVETQPETCTCNGGWVEDQNWSPEHPGEWDGRRSPEDGLIPCGHCNEGGWDAAWPPEPSTPSELPAAPSLGVEAAPAVPVQEADSANAGPRHPAGSPGVHFQPGPQMAGSTGDGTPAVPVQAEPRQARVWNEGDPEPEDFPRVRGGTNGVVFASCGLGYKPWFATYESGGDGRWYAWRELVGSDGPLPLTEVVEQAPAARHQQLLADPNDTIRKIAELHAPTGSDSELRCGGCDYAGYDGEPADWPCRTWTLLADGPNGGDR